MRKRLPRLRHKPRKLPALPKRPVKGTTGAVMESVARQRERCTIGSTGSLPERMIRFALTKLGVPFQEQASYLSGHSTFAVIDFVVYPNTPNAIALRVQSYWHEHEDHRTRALWDIVQSSRLHARGLEVRDIYEADLYRAAEKGCHEVIRYVSKTIYATS